jgi:SAM-dependent methyltransferase
MNPWLTIPLADYESHMALPQVGQAAMLAGVLEAAVRARAPRSVAVLGCAGGNGFERLSPDLRVVGVDLHPAYVAVARERHGARLPKLELEVGDVERDAFRFAPVELAYAGLLFEYVDAAATLDAIRARLCERGALVTVLQLPSDALPEITPSPFASLAALGPALRLVEPQGLAALAAARGYRPLGAEIATASGGKRFAVQTFERG